MSTSEDRDPHARSNKIPKKVTRPPGMNTVHPTNSNTVTVPEIELNSTNANNGMQNNCDLCNQPDHVEDMVACDLCSLWFHYTCARVTADIANSSFVCVHCKRAVETGNIDSDTHVCIRCDVESNGSAMKKCKQCNKWFHVKCMPRNELGNNDICMECSSIQNHPTTSRAGESQHKSQTSARSSKSTSKLLLLQLEEEKALEKKRLDEKEAIEVQRYEMEQKFLRRKYDVMRAASSCEGSIKSISGRSLRSIKEWLNNTENKNYGAKNQSKNKLVNIDNGAIRESQLLRHEDRRVNKNINPILISTSTDANRFQEAKGANDYRVNLNAQNQSTFSNLSGINPTADIEFQGRSDYQISSAHLAARHAATDKNRLPTFTGDIMQWPMFKAAFVQSTERCGFTNSDNLERLQKCLQGDALTTVQSLLTFADMVPFIMSTLQRRFGRPELIINMVINQIDKQSSITNEDLESLVNFSINVQNLCATIIAAGQTAYFNSPMLMASVVMKLPANLQLDWAKFKRNLHENQVTLATFNEWLLDWSNAASEISYTRLSLPIDLRSRSQRKQKGCVNVTSENTFEKNELSNKFKTKCVVCKNIGHALENCQSFEVLNRPKRWNVVDKFRLCRRCFGPHFLSACKVSSKCGINNCARNHHPLLHNYTKDTGYIKSKGSSDEENTAKNPKISNLKTVAQVTSHNHYEGVDSVVFRIIPVCLYGKNGSKVETFAFLDDGSSVTLIDRGLADELELEGEEENLNLQWTGNIVREEKGSKKVSLCISGRAESNSKYRLNNVRTVQELNLPMQSMVLNEAWKSYQHLQHISVSQYTNAAPRILIGVDNYKLTVPLKVKEGGWREPLATKTRLGWVIAGPSSKTVTQDLGVLNYHNSQSPNNTIHTLINDYFSIENFGVRACEKSITSKEDMRSQEILKVTSVFDGNRYESGLLWRDDDSWLPYNFSIAMSRLKGLETKMAKEPVLAKFLKEQIEEYLKKGFIRRLDSMNEIPNNKRRWFLPIFVVHNPNKANKPRIVWDAAAEYQGMSLNTLLMKGPEPTISLIGILHRFRENPVAIVGDIAQMFHQIRVKKEDQYSQLFLWRDGDMKTKVDTFVMQVLTFGATCSPAIAEYVKNTNAERFSKQYPSAVNAIITNHYVDDWLDSFPDEDTAVKVIEQVKFIHESGGFTMRNWISNSKAVLGKVTGNDARESLHQICTGSNEKVLGIWWCIETDSFIFKVKSTDISELRTPRPTRREALRFIMSTYDPLGLIGFIIIQLKVFMQDLCKLSSSWDDQMPCTMESHWKELVEIIKSVQSIKIPRHYFGGIILSQPIQLHVFVDASERAYSAVAYYRFARDGGFNCTLVGSKTKVAPNKPLSIPRLELMAAVLGSRFMNSLCETHSLKIDRRFIWTDSQTVLQWLSMDARKFKQFVALRVGEILDSTELNMWRWVPSKFNAADFATKWHSQIKNVSLDSQWFRGPEFLLHDEVRWPKIKVNTVSQGYLIDDELRFPLSSHREIKVNAFIIPELSKFSKWTRLLGAMAKVYDAVRRFKMKICKNEINENSSNVVENIYCCAEINLMRYAQWSVFRTEIIQLQKFGSVERSSSLYKLSATIDKNDLLRISGRTENASTFITADQQHPIILPRKHHITHLIIQWYHEKFHHSQHETVVNELRQRFYIPRLRVELKVVRSRCQKCINENSKPLCPPMSSLPPSRLAVYSKPFSFVGIDYFGPLEVIVGRRIEKRWGVLFTCLTVRAVHLEIAYSLSSSSCIMAISRFIRCRGWPNEIITDNGTNFRGATSELEREIKKINNNDLEEKYNSIKWSFIPPSAPHMGGAWERLIRTVKSILQEIIPMRRPTDEILITALKEIEGIINMRPLTYIPIDPDEQEALTPNHFLLGSSGGKKILGDFRDTPELLRRDWRIAQQMADIFWKRFIKEYLPNLTRRTKWFESVPEIKNNDIVIICDDAAPRNQWKKAIVIDAIQGRDGKVRCARLRTAKGELTRPVSKLAKLDLVNGKTDTNNKVSTYVGEDVGKKIC